MWPDDEKAAENTCCIVKDFEEVWAHFCPPKPCLPLSTDTKMLVAAMPIYIGVRMKVFSNFPFVLGKNGFPKLFYIHAVSIMKYRVEQTGSGRGAENGFLRALGRGARAGIFRRVDYVIRFEQYSMVKPVHIRIGVMVRREPQYALHILF